MSVNTPCKDCVFSTWNEKTQVGCSAGRIELFKKANIPIIEAVDENGKEFYVINNRFCLFCRNKDWGEKYNKEYWPQIADVETLLQYQVIILARNSTLDQIKNTCDSFFSQYIKPRHISVIFDILKPPKVGRLLDEYKVPWRLQHVQDDTITDFQQIDIVIDLKKYAFAYYIVAEAGKTVEPDLIKTLHTKTRDEFIQFGVIKNLGNTKYIVPRAIHSFYNGNSEFSLEEKLIKDNFGDRILESL